MKQIDFSQDLVAREVTDEEVAFYDDHGWVKLEQLISPELAAELLAAGKEIKRIADQLPPPGDANRASEHEFFQRVVETSDWTLRWHGELFMAWDIRTEPVFGFTHSSSLGRAAHRLIHAARLGKDVGVRYLLST